jgi:hypothetical protein
MATMGLDLRGEHLFDKLASVPTVLQAAFMFLEPSRASGDANETSRAALDALEGVSDELLCKTETLNGFGVTSLHATTSKHSDTPLWRSTCVLNVVGPEITIPDEQVVSEDL